MAEVLLLGLGTVLIGVCARITERSWVAPSVVFAVLWGGYLIISAAFVPDPELLVGAGLWVTAACAAVYCGALFGHTIEGSGGHAAYARRGSQEPSFPALRALVGACVLVGVAEIVHLFIQQGLSLKAVVSFVALAQLAALNRSEYGYGELQQGFIERLAFAALYFAPFVGSLLYSFPRRRGDRVLGAAALAVCITVPALYGSRMGVLFGASFWIGGYLAARSLPGAHSQLGDTRLLLRIGSVAILLLLGVSSLAQVLRYSGTTDRLDWFRILADPFGFLAAFSIWLDQDGVRLTGLFAGARTFRRIVELVGISQPLAPAIEVGFTSSNIYTVFRDLIEDFGMPGALVCLVAYGVAGRVSLRAVSSGRAVYVPVLAIIYAFALTSFAISIFLYTVTTLAVILFLLYGWLGGIGWATVSPARR